MKKSKKSSTQKNNKLALLLIIIIFSFISLRLGRDRFFDWDEAIYAELGKNILSGSGLLTPAWNGGIWLEKPPGIAWITALGMSILGVGELGGRLFMPVFGALTLYFVYKISRKFMGEKLSLLSVLLLSNMELFVSRARALNTDGPLLALIASTVYAALYGYSFWVISLAVSLSVMVKGLAGFLPLIIIFPLYLNKLKDYFKISLYSLLFTLPWHLYEFFVNGEKFINPYFKEQVLRRATVPIEFHLESRWYYFAYLAENLNLAYILFSCLSMFILIRKFIKKHEGSSLLLSWWTLFPLGLFTLAKTRLFWYILPVYPALAILTAYFFSIFAKSKQYNKILTLFLVLYFPLTLSNILKFTSFNRTTRNSTEIIDLVTNLNNNDELAVLVSENERVAEAILPESQRISSSFRYGGMPTAVFYHGGRVKFFYDIPDFLEYWDKQENPQALITKKDLSLLENYKISNQLEEYSTIEK